LALLAAPEWRAGPRAMTKSALYEAALEGPLQTRSSTDNTLYVRINQLRKILEPLVGTDPIQTPVRGSATYRVGLPGIAYLLVATSLRTTSLRELPH